MTTAAPDSESGSDRQDGQAGVGDSDAMVKLENAALAGDVASMRRLGQKLYKSKPEVAEAWLERAAEAGDAWSMVRLGNALHDSNPEVAAAWLERAAELGDPTATYNLGVRVRKRDPERAHRLWRKAADDGVPEAMYWLGHALEASDPAESRRLYEQAAASGLWACVLRPEFLGAAGGRPASPVLFGTRCRGWQFRLHAGVVGGTVGRRPPRGN